MSKKKSKKGQPLPLWLALPVVVLVIILRLLIPGDETEAATPVSVQADALTVRFFNVGQGASTLLSMGDTHILVDAGENDMGGRVLANLQGLGIDHLALAVGSHPHSDHIGGMDKVLEAVDCELYWMPDAATTTKTFSDVLDVLEEKSIPVEYPPVGKTQTFGGITLTVLSPLEPDDDDLNNASLVLRVTCDYGSVLLPGDAEKQMEKQMLDGGMRLTADVLLLSHHGSSTGNTSAFLAAVNPKIAVIPVGADNDYGHPHAEVLERLADRGLTPYRTDENGTVAVTLNAKGITVETEK